MSESQNWQAPPPGTLTTPGEDVARLADGSVVFVRDPFRRAPQRQPRMPRPAAKDTGAGTRVEEDARPWWIPG